MGQLSSDSEDEIDEVALEAKRKAALEKKKQERNAVLKRREDERMKNEAKWYLGAKEARIEKLSFEDQLSKKLFFLTADEKSEFTDEVRAEVIDHFERNVPNFQEQISKITEKDQLLDLIYKAHKSITNDQMEPAEHMRIHQILADFQTPIIGALKEMTEIPKDEKLVELETGNVFFEARERILKESRDKIEINFEDLVKKYNEASQKQIEEEVGKLTEALADLLPGDATTNERVLEEFSAISISHLTNPVRDTSPTRFQFSDEALRDLDAALSAFTIDPAVRDLPRAPQVEDYQMESSDSDEDIDSIMMAPLKRPERYAKPLEEIGGRRSMAPEQESADDSDEYDNSLPNEKADPSDYRLEHNTTEHNEKSIIQGTERLRRSRRRLPSPETARKLKKIVDKVKAINQKVEVQRKEAKTDEQMAMIDDWLKRRSFDVVKAEMKRKVRFQPFDSPENRFRVFVKPGGMIRRQTNYDPDEGPGFEWKEMGLKEGWDLLKEKKTKHPMTIKGQTFKVAKGDRKTKCVQRLVKYQLEDWMTGTGLMGNLLGRFWFRPLQEYLDFRNTGAPTKDEDEDVLEYWHHFRNRRGLNLTYEFKDLVELYAENWVDVRENLKRSIDRYCKVKSDYKRSQVATVLIITDWRLAFLDQRVLMNAVVQYVPSETGRICFDTLLVYLELMLTNPRIEINTLVFAMGGSPSYETDYFKKFITELKYLCLRHVKVHWYAQDWLDGMKFTEEEKQHYLRWNQCIEKTIQLMREKGFLNYYFHNVRLQAGLTIEPPFCPDQPKLEHLERIYNLYVRHFGNNAGVTIHRNFFVTLSREFTDHPENSSLNPRCAIVHKHNEKDPYKGEEYSEEYGY